MNVKRASEPINKAIQISAEMIHKYVENPWTDSKIPSCDPKIQLMFLKNVNVHEKIRYLWAHQFRYRSFFLPPNASMKDASTF